MLRSTVLLTSLALLSNPVAAQHRSSFPFNRDEVQHRKTERLAPSVLETHKGGETQALHYASNFRLDKADTAIHTLLINIHGLHRDVMGAYESAEYAAKSARQYKRTLIISPQYTNDEDLNDIGLGNKFLYWKHAEWKDGRPSVTDDWRGHKIAMNSYEVMDSLISYVLGSGNFPNIRKVIVAGHSAGGQFVQRYSAITPLPDLRPSLLFRFIVMNPSSYMYLDERRPAAGGTFAIPDSTGCGQYNRYPKGLTELSDYAAAIGADRIRHNMLHRDIVFLLGGDDTNDADKDLDVSCAAEVQGKARLQRGLNFYNYLSSFPEYEQKKHCRVIPDIGHNGRGIINSDEAENWIFGRE